MQHTRLALLFAASVVAGVITLVACGDDAATVPLPGGGTTSSSSSGKSSSGATDDDTTDDDTTDDDDSVDSGGDANCKTAPRLHPTDKGYFCSFFDGGPGDSGAGGRNNCPNETVCCNPGKNGTAFPPTYCADNANPGDAVQSCDDGAGAANSTWVPTGGTAWECGSTSNCPNNMKCCATSAPGADGGNYVNVGPLKDDKVPAACNAKLLFKVFGTKCADACKDPKQGEIEVCSSTDGCGGGKNCIPVRGPNNRDLGACQ